MPALLPGAAPGAVMRAAAPGRDKQRRPAALRPLPARWHGARRQLPPVLPPVLPPARGRGVPALLPPGAAVAPCAPPRAPLAGSATPALRPELAAALFVYFPAAVAGCQARGPFLLKTHFSCPARSGSLLAALRSAAKSKRGRVLPGAGGGGWSRACLPLSLLPSLLPSLIPPGAAGGSRGASCRAPGRGDRPRSRPSHFLPSGAAAKR